MRAWESFAARALRLGPDHREAIESLIDACLTKAEAGTDKYGALDLETDTRDFVNEANDDKLDLINYQSIEIVRLRRQLRRLQQAVDWRCM